MREIKFRAWDGIKMRGIGNLQDRFSIRNDGVVNGNIDYILMQYTGLKDKNGVEIYEGDIVCILSEEPKFSFTGTVIFDAGGFCIDYTNGLVELKYYNFISEVVNNVYQNHKLLE